jgi:hypothetical protein
MRGADCRPSAEGAPPTACSGPGCALCGDPDLGTPGLRARLRALQRVVIYLTHKTEVEIGSKSLISIINILYLY